MAFNIENGEIIAVNKPYRWTSFDALAAIRSTFRKVPGVAGVKIGHAGTLDPLATGLLLLCIGPATKRIEEIQELEKEYTGTLVLGATTLSFDLEKPVDKLFPVDHIDSAMILEAAAILTGDCMQVPPMFSAVKVKGKRAYKSARTGKTLELNARPVKINFFGITRISMPEVDFRIRCSKGTYIRSIVRDMGTTLGSGAYLSSLCRTRIGPYCIDDAWTIEGLKSELLKQFKQPVVDF